jgi:hypothetical protein
MVPIDRAHSAAVARDRDELLRQLPRHDPIRITVAGSGDTHARGAQPRRREHRGGHWRYRVREIRA